MRNIHCLEILERNGKEEKVKERFPFDAIPDKISYISNIDEMYEIIEKYIDDKQTKEATKTRLWYILELWYPKHFYRFGRMNWKWD